MRYYLKTFAFLDFISILLLSTQVFEFMQHWDQIPDEMDSKIKVYVTILMFISLFFTTIGLFFMKKWAAIVYYIQFVFRILIWVFSIGFISVVVQWINFLDNPIDLIFKICMVGEFIRLYFTILAHRKKELY